MPVFSVTDFKEGLDVRKTPLTAPGGSLRILENAVLNQGGEIEKRFAFVPMTTVPSAAGPILMVGHGGGLHVFGVNPATIPPGALPVPITYHQLEAPPDPITFIADAEPYDDKFYVCGYAASSGLNYVWYNDILVKEADGSYSAGSYARLWKSKMYRLNGPYLRFSGVGNPAQNDPASVSEPGAGFINLALNDPDGETAVGMEVFYQNMAIMAELQTQIWTLDPDPTQDTLTQLLRIGLVARRSIVQFGTGDVLFLSPSGVRSLKAQTITLAASVSDVGSAIDLLLIPQIRANLGVVANTAEAIVQPIQGRYWLAIGNTVYVLSYFPAGNITAWSTFALDFNVLCLVVVNQSVYVLDTAGNVYLYGGLDNATYDSCLVTIQTPHMSADNPTENKRIQSVDVMCQGLWNISIGMLPNATDLFELVATVQDNTFGLQSIPFAGYGTHFGVYMTHQAPGPALLAALHFNLLPGVVK